MTVTTLADSIAGLAPHLPAELFPPAGLERMRRATELLPGALARVIGFECRLGAGDSPADLLFLADVASGGRAILAGGHPGAAMPRELLASPAWRTVQGFSAVWADPGSPLHRGVDDVWFELDMDDPGAEASGPAPSLFFGPKVAHLEAATLDDPERRAQRGSVEILCDALALLSGEPLSGPWRDRLVRCVEALPPAARVFQAGRMLSRPSQPVRLCITNLAAAAIPSYLARAGWEGAADDLAPLLADLAPVAGSIKLTLDVSAGERSAAVGRRIGLECYPGMEHAWQPGPRWEALLDHLVRRGLATAAKRAALLAFPGLGAAADDDLAALLGGRAERVLVRWLHHAKVTYEPGRLPGAKAYLAVRGDWLR